MALELGQKVRIWETRVMCANSPNFQQFQSEFPTDIWAIVFLLQIVMVSRLFIGRGEPSGAVVLVRLS